ncbi:MAG TPA: hypothetical protein DF383_10310 [Deltaproteobacteria bacterium]|nr:hypothetical protein [Deltaproteobacteria bacterium]
MLRFDPEKHLYWLGDRPLVSVTQALTEASIIDSRWYTEEAKNRGTAVHKACELLDLDDLEFDSLHPTIRPYVEAYLQFKRDTGFVPELIEHRVYNETYFYAGTLDRAGRIGKEKVVIDLKSGAVEPWAALQISAYEACLSGHYTRMALPLTDTGKYRRPIEYKDPNDFKVFLNAVGVAHWKRNNNIKMAA